MADTSRASLGFVTSYGAARRGGYTGTYEEWCELMATVADHLEENRTIGVGAAAAKAAAEAAQLAAEEAQGKAEDAQDAAEDAQGAAETAQAAAETAQGAAESAQSGAEDARDAASGYASAASGSASQAAGSAASAAAELTTVQAAGTAAVGAVQSAQATAVAAVEEAAEEITENVEQIQTNKEDISDLKESIEQVERDNTEKLDLSQYTKNNVNISPSNNKWLYGSSYSSWMIKRPHYANYVVITGGVDGSFVALLSSNDQTSGQVPDYATGWTNRKEVQSGKTVLFPLPDDCTYVWTSEHTSEQNDYTPLYFGFSVIGKIDEIERQIDQYITPLPFGYTQLEYLQSTGSEYVDLGFKANQNNRFVCKFAITDDIAALSGNGNIFGGRKTAASLAFALQYISSRKGLTLGYGNNQYIVTANNTLDNEIHVIDINRNSIYFDGSLAVTAEAETFTSEKNIYLFAVASSSGTLYGKTKIYRVTVYNNDVIARDLIPCIRDADGVCGFYDTVKDGFYTVSDSETIIKGSVTSIDNLYERVEKTEREVGDLDNRVVDITTRFDDTLVPEYVKTEADRVSSKVRGDQNGTSITFVACSDIHYPVAVKSGDGVSVETAQRAAKDLSQAILQIAGQTHIDFYACFGDVIYQWQSHAANYDNGVREMTSITKLLSDAFGNNPQVRMVGNHDPNCENNDGKEFTAYLMNAYTGIYDDMLIRDPDYPYGAYGYHDFERQKVRLIVLNTSFFTPETDLTNGATRYYLGYEQAYWLCQTLDLSAKSDTQDWKIIICSHVRIDDLNNMNIRYGAHLLKQYISGGTWTGGEYSYDFSGKNSAEIIAYMNGHSHKYYVRNIHDITGSSEGDPLSIANLFVPNALPGRDGESFDGETYTKTADSAESTAFQIITIDFENKVIYARHYGAGIDIVLHYDPSSEASYSTTLTSPTWAAVDTTIATVSDGTVTPVASGYTMVYAKSETDNCIECWNYQSLI